MKDHAVTFPTDLVYGLLNGTKTTARAPAAQWRNFNKGVGVQPGDRLWVRENFAFVGGGDPGILLYEVDWRRTVKALKLDHADDPPKWTSMMRMPRRLSRLTLEISAVRTEGLQEISEADAIEDVARYATVGDFRSWTDPEEHGEFPATVPDDAMLYISDYDRSKEEDADRSVTLDPRVAYRALWDEYHPLDPWRSDPVVIVLTFVVHRRIAPLSFAA